MTSRLRTVRAGPLRSLATAARWLAAAALLFSGACGQGSCVQFDAQDVRVRFDREKDRLDALIVYSGLTADGGDVSGAVEQLEKVRAGRIIALIDNFPAIDFESDSWDGTTKAERPELVALARALDAAASVTNGPLWRDLHGQLAGYQLVRVDRVSSVLAAANALIGAECLAEQERRARDPARRREAVSDPASVDEWFDDAVLDRFVESARAGAPFVSLRGGALVVFVPADAAQAQRFRRAVLADMRRDLASRDRDEAHWHDLELIGRNRLATHDVPGGLEIVLGDPSAAELHLEVPPHGRAGTDLGEALASKGWTIEGPGGEGRALAAFAEWCGQP